MLILELFFFIQYLVASSFLYVLRNVVFTLIFFFLISEFKYSSKGKRGYVLIPFGFIFISDHFSQIRSHKVFSLVIACEAIIVTASAGAFLPLLPQGRV